MCCSFLNTHYSHSDAAYLISVSKIAQHFLSCLYFIYVVKVYLL